MRSTITGTPKVLTPDNPDHVVATPRHSPPDLAFDLRRRREIRAMRFDVRTDWLAGIVNSRDRVTVAVEIHTERLSGRWYDLVMPTIDWTRQDIYDPKPWRVRWWSEEPLKVTDRDAAHAAADALLDALTTTPAWLHVINDGAATSLGDALALAAAGVTQ